MKTKTAAKLAASEEGIELAASMGALGRVFDPPISRQAVHLWGPTVPAERLKQLKLLRPSWFEPRA